MTDEKAAWLVDQIAKISKRDRIPKKFLTRTVALAIRFFGEQVIEDRGLDATIQMGCELESWAEVGRYARLAMAVRGGDDEKRPFGAVVIDEKSAHDMYACVIAIRDPELAAQTLQAMSALVGHEIEPEVREWT
jgi:hypothetical protein